MKMNLTERSCRSVDWIGLVHDRTQKLAPVHKIMNFEISLKQRIS
jgi:hypothetical protein